MASEETARLATRMDGIESTLMVQSGALANAAEQAAAHRTELNKTMQDLQETLVHMGTPKSRVEERPAVRVPPGFHGADLQVTPTRPQAPAEAEGPDPSEDPWAATTCWHTLWSCHG